MLVWVPAFAGMTPWRRMGLGMRMAQSGMCQTNRALGDIRRAAPTHSVIPAALVLARAEMGGDPDNSPVALL